MAGDADLEADGAGPQSQTEAQAPFRSPELRARLVGQIHALTAVRLALAAAVTLALAPTSLTRGGAGEDGDEQGSGRDGAPWESKDGAGTMMAAATVLASPVVYAGLLALIFYRRPRGVVGAAVLLAIGLTEGAAIGGALALVGWTWIVKMVVVSLVVAAAMFAGLALAAFHAASQGTGTTFAPWTLAATALCGLLGVGASAAMVRPNALEVAVGAIAAIAGVYFAIADVMGAVGRVRDDEAGLGAAVLGMSSILDSIGGQGERGTA